MSSYSLAATVFVAGVVLWRIVSNLGSAARTSPLGTLRASALAPGFAPEPDSIPAPGSALAVVAVALDEIAAAATQLGEGFALDARAEVAQALRAAVRRQDLCTPWRDNLMIAVLPGVDPHQAPALRLRVQRALSEIRIVTHTGEEHGIGFQVVSACAPEDGASEAELMSAAERRLARNRPASASPRTGTHAQLCAALPILSN